MELEIARNRAASSEQRTKRNRRARYHRALLTEHASGEFQRLRNFCGASALKPLGSVRTQRRHPLTAVILDDDCKAVGVVDLTRRQEPLRNRESVVFEGVSIEATTNEHDSGRWISESLEYARDEFAGSELDWSLVMLDEQHARIRAEAMKFRSMGETTMIRQFNAQELFPVIPYTSWSDEVLRLRLDNDVERYLLKANPEHADGIAELVAGYAVNRWGKASSETEVYSGVARFLSDHRDEGYLCRPSTTFVIVDDSNNVLATTRLEWHLNIFTNCLEFEYHDTVRGSRGLGHKPNVLAPLLFRCAAKLWESLPIELQDPSFGLVMKMTVPEVDKGLLTHLKSEYYFRSVGLTNFYHQGK